MACRRRYRNTVTSAPIEEESAKKLYFGVDSKVPAYNLLQNNLDLFEWVTRNKIYPAFWGRNITGKNSITMDEIGFLRKKACRIAAICSDTDAKETEEQGRTFAEKAVDIAHHLGINKGSAIFLEIEESESNLENYMLGFAKELIFKGYTPGFKANTDTKYAFYREFGRLIQMPNDFFAKCVVWATAPILTEYDRITTTHLIQPDNWTPCSPFGISRNDIAIWQYGKDCHRIYDNDDKETVFNINLVRNTNIITKKMF
jgi:hypothetical protein